MSVSPEPAEAGFLLDRDSGVAERLALFVSNAIRFADDAQIGVLIGNDPLAKELRELRRDCAELREKVDRYVERGCRLCGSLAQGNSDSLLYPRNHHFYGSRPERDPHEDYLKRMLFHLCRGCREEVDAAVLDRLLAAQDSARLAHLGDSFVAAWRTPAIHNSPRTPANEVYWAGSPEDTSIVKIGCAVTAEERLSQLGLVPWLIEGGGEPRERHLHSRYKDFRLGASDVPAWVPRDGRTEWFVNEGPVAHYISTARLAA